MQFASKASDRWINLHGIHARALRPQSRSDVIASASTNDQDSPAGRQDGVGKIIVASGRLNTGGVCGRAEVEQVLVKIVVHVQAVATLRRGHVGDAVVGRPLNGTV